MASTRSWPNRLVDTVQAATDIAAAANDDSFVASEGADPVNVRTRNFYDPDGNVRAVLGPRAFTGSVTSPNVRFMSRVDVDEAGRSVAQWTSYYDNTTDAALGIAPFENDCPTPGSGHQPALVAGVPAYPSTTGICVTRTEFDAAGNLVRATNPTAVVPAQDQRFQTLRYSDDNLLVAVEGPNPAAGDVDARIDTVRMGYDASGRTLFQSTPTGRVTTAGGAEQRWVSETAYSPDGLPLVVEQRPLTSATAQRRVETTFDHGGNPVRTDTMISATRTDTSTTDWFADGMRRESSTTVTGHNAGAVTWRWGYDPAGNTTHTWSPSAVAGAANNTAGVPTVMAYSPDGLVTEMAEPVRADGGQLRETSFGHDPLGRVVQENVALVGVNPATSPPRSYSWTTLGQPATETGRDGAVQSFTYNAAGQLTSATESVHGTVVEAGYYLNGWLRDTASVRPNDPDSFQKFQYWGDGLEGWRWFADDAGFTQAISIQGYGYNDARAMTAVVPAGWAFSWEAWLITNDRAGRPVSMTDPPDGAAPARTTIMDRNPDGTVAQQRLHSGAAGTAVIDEWDYTYDSTGRVASKARSGTGTGTVNEVYGYDEAGRLATINAGQVSYDPNGNRLSGPGMPTLSFRADNSIGTGPDENGSGAEAYLYAPWGGLTQDACRSYSYDGFDRSRTTTIRKRALDLLPRCNIVEDLLEVNDEKRYDALGRNTWAKHDRLNVVGSTADTDYVHLHHVGLGQDVVVEQTVGEPARSGRYINTPGGTPLAVVDGNDNREFLHRDGHNDTVLAVGDNGQVACAPNLSVSGESDTDCDDPLLPESANRKWYNSSRLGPATDTYQWGSRTYNPETATWQQPDTPALSGSPSQVSIGTDPLVANRYAYVNGDPINYTDPTGHEPCPRDGGCTGEERVTAAEWDRMTFVAEVEHDVSSILEAEIMPWSWEAREPGATTLEFMLALPTAPDIDVECLTQRSKRPARCDAQISALVEFTAFQEWVYRGQLERARDEGRLHAHGILPSGYTVGPNGSVIGPDGVRYSGSKVTPEWVAGLWRSTGHSSASQGGPAPTNTPRDCQVPSVPAGVTTPNCSATPNDFDSLLPQFDPGHVLDVVSNENVHGCISSGNAFGTVAAGSTVYTGLGVTVTYAGGFVVGCGYGYRTDLTHP